MERIDNDMDDLFRKAGEQYPLKISGEDWDAIAGKLQNENLGDLNTVPFFTAGEVRSKRKWRLLLILIPLVLTSAIFTSRLVSQQHKGSTSQVVTNQPAGLPNEAKIKPGTGIDNASGEINSGAETNNSSKQEVVPDNQTGTNAGRKTEGSIFGKNGLRSAKSNKETYSAALNSYARNERVSGHGAPAPQQAETTGESTEKTIRAPVAVVAEQKESSAVTGNTPDKETAKTTGKDSTVSGKKTVRIGNGSRGFYAGVLVGPDFSTVDLQSVKKTGFSLGIIAGYRFNKRLALETGLLFDKKYYYSDGTHYKSQSNPVPPNWNVVGSCNMLEIPLALRYDFAFGKTHSFFAKAGLSSYLMKKQDYSYYWEANGVPYSHTDPTNHSSMNYIFSIVQLSGGYDFAISGKTKIRIEPYVKIPLEGIGQGSMPISSAGVYFGITHSFR